MATVMIVMGILILLYLLGKPLIERIPIACPHRLGEPTDGYQRCVLCGKVEAVPAKECSHEWKTLREERIKQKDGFAIGDWISIECKKCGVPERITKRIVFRGT
jgi:hypothetical protein